MGMLRSDPRPRVVCGKSRTQQHVADLCSPKRLIEKYGSRRLKEALDRIPSMYSDVPLASDYKEACDVIARGEMSFSSLPSGLRKRFDNDPYKLLEFLNEDKNRDEAITLGLIPKPAVTDEAKRKDVKKVNKDEPDDDFSIDDEKPVKRK